jgi:hypothetical protein
MLDGSGLLLRVALEQDNDAGRTRPARLGQLDMDLAVVVDRRVDLDGLHRVSPGPPVGDP